MKAGREGAGCDVIISALLLEEGGGRVVRGPWPREDLSLLDPRSARVDFERAVDDASASAPAFSGVPSRDVFTLATAIEDGRTVWEAAVAEVKTCRP